MWMKFSVKFQKGVTKSRWLQKRGGVRGLSVAASGDKVCRNKWDPPALASKKAAANSNDFDIVHCNLEVVRSLSMVLWGTIRVRFPSTNMTSWSVGRSTLPPLFWIILHPAELHLFWRIWQATITCKYGLIFQTMYSMLTGYRLELSQWKAVVQRLLVKKAFVLRLDVGYQSIQPRINAIIKG